MIEDFLYLKTHSRRQTLSRHFPDALLDNASSGVTFYLPKSGMRYSLYPDLLFFACNEPQAASIQNGMDRCKSSLKTSYNQLHESRAGKMREELVEIRNL